MSFLYNGSYDSNKECESDYTQGYMPTRKRLNDVDGKDWYM